MPKTMSAEKKSALFQERLNDMHDDVRAAFERGAGNRLEQEEIHRRQDQIPVMSDEERERFRLDALKDIVVSLTPFPTREEQDALVRRAKKNEAAGFGTKESRPDTLYSMVTSLGVNGPVFAQEALEDEKRAAHWQAMQFIESGKQTGNQAVDSILGQNMGEMAKRQALISVIAKDDALITQAVLDHEAAQKSRGHVEQMTEGKSQRVMQL
jgi:hypothetical protein